MIHFVNDLEDKGEGKKKKTQNKQKKETHNEQKPHQTNIKNQVFHTGATTGLNIIRLV